MTVAGTVLAIVGPTAAGKSALSLALADRLGGEVVNADSMQLYRGMDIGTAKLTPAERHGIAAPPARHLGRSPQSASVAEYQRLARAAIDDILARGRVPLLVGGSGLYVRAALEHFDFPGTDAALRARLEAELADVGPGPLHARLAAMDPAAAAKILPSNGRRIVRALEVIELTGAPFAAALPDPTPVYPSVQIGVDLDTATLDERIAARVRHMWSTPAWSTRSGRCCPRVCATGVTASRALGYQQVLAYLDGRSDLDRGGRRHDPGDPAVRPPAAHVVPPRPADQAGWTATAPDLRRRRDCDDGTRTDGSDGRAMKFAKAHGTGNDFVVLPDPDGALDLTPRLVAALCDRRRGIGGDGVLRVVRSAKHPEAADLAGEAEWFMDYRNADGSIAEMCGNGVRAYVRYLASSGLIAGRHDPLDVATRAGVVPVADRLRAPDGRAAGADRRRRVDGDGRRVGATRASPRRRRQPASGLRGGRRGRAERCST